MAEYADVSGTDQVSDASSFASWGDLVHDHSISNNSNNSRIRNLELYLKHNGIYSSDSSSSDSEDDSVPMEERLKARGAFEIRYFNKDLLVAKGYKKVKTLGKGLSGDVILARSKENADEEYAIKRFNLDANDRTSRAMLLVREVTLTSKLRHPHIISKLVPYQCPRYAAISMPYYPLGNLGGHINTLRPSQIKPIFVQLGWAVKYMHRKKIIHRDIKLDNILVKRANFIVLADFGLACKISRRQKLEGAVGSTAFMAPEVRSFDDHKTSYNGFLADSYSCGVVLWAMLLRTIPTKSSRLVESIRSSSDALEPSLTSVALQLLQEDPRTRTVVSHLDLPSVRKSQSKKARAESNYKEPDYSSWLCLNKEN